MGGNPNQPVGQTGKSKDSGGRETWVQILPLPPPGSVTLSQFHGLSFFTCEMGIIISLWLLRREVTGHSGQWLSSEARLPGLNPSCTTYYLCNLVQVT